MNHYSTCLISMSGGILTTLGSSYFWGPVYDEEFHSRTGIYFLMAGLVLDVVAILSCYKPTQYQVSSEQFGYEKGERTRIFTV